MLLPGLSSCSDVSSNASVPSLECRFCCLIFLSLALDIYGSMYHDTVFTKMTNKMQLCRIIYCSLTALHVSSNIFAHHQEHLNCNYSFWFYSRHHRLLPWLSRNRVSTQQWQQPPTTHVNKTRSCNYSKNAPDDERKYRSKHVEQSRNNKLFYTVVSCWSFL